MAERFEWRGCALFDIDTHQVVSQRSEHALWLTDHGADLLSSLLNDLDERQKARLDTIPGESASEHNARVCQEPAPCSCEESLELRKRLAVAHRRNALAVEVLCKHNDDLPTNVKLQLWNALHDGATRG